MSLPDGSKQLDAKIGSKNVYYLIDDNEVSATFSTLAFTPTLAKPLNNYKVNHIDPNIIKTIEESFPNTKNNIVSLFNLFPNILTTHNDIIIGDVDSSIDVTFVTEGAGYLNAVGYYFYYIDTNGKPHILTNSDDNTNQNNNAPYYCPTIVFPNASLSRSGGDLQSGGTRTLKGNLPNGKFRNINVGFFLISNGWRASGDGYMSNGTGYTMHTTNEFNANYDASYLLEENVSVSDPRRGVQSGLLYNTGVTSWLLGFEDILRPYGDSDFNDCVLLIKKTPKINDEDIDNYTSVVHSEQNNHIAQVDSDGLFLWLDMNKICNNGSTLYFDREMHFKPTHINYHAHGHKVDQSPRDYVKGLIQNLNWNYVSGESSIVENTGIDDDNILTQRFRFLPQDIIDNTLNNYCKLYILKRQFNIDNQNIINDNEETNYNILLNYQSILVDKWYSSNNGNNSIYIDYEKFKFKCDDIDNDDLNNDCTNINFTKITEVQLCWGDPYIQKMDGKVSKLPDIPSIYTLLKNNCILIEGETDISPHTEQIPQMKGTTFFKRFIINVFDKAKFEINMRTFEFNTDGCVKCKLGYDKDIVDTINDKFIRDAITNERNLLYLTVYIDNIKVSFVKLPTSIDIQNMVLFDMSTFKSYASSDSQGGMISDATCFRRPADEQSN